MLVERLRVFVYINRQALGLIIYCCGNSDDVKINQLDFTTSYNYSWSHGISSTMQQSPDLRPPMTIIADKLVKLVESTGLQKISTTQHLEVDAQDPSFITTRPYFEPSSTGISLDSASYFCLSSCHYIDYFHQSIRVEQRAAYPGDECLFFSNSSGSYAALSTRWHSQVSRVLDRVAPLSAFLTHANW